MFSLSVRFSRYKKVFPLLSLSRGKAVFPILECLLLCLPAAFAAFQFSRSELAFVFPFCFKKDTAVTARPLGGSWFPLVRYVCLGLTLLYTRNVFGSFQ